MKRIALVAIILSVCLATPLPAQPKKNTKPADAPTFQLRARVTKIAGAEPGKRKFTFRFNVKSTAASTVGDAWSDWLTFGQPQIDAILNGYPALYLRNYPVVARLVVAGVADPTDVEAEIRFDETKETFKLKGELFGPNLGILIWREDKQPKAATMAQYNHRYWKHLASVKAPEAERPKLFPIVDRFIGGDDDRISWREGIEQLARAGFSVLMLPPSRPIRDIYMKTGLKRTSWAVYSPPGYAFDFNESITPESLRDWAEKQAKPYLAAGYAKEDMAIFAMSDEPGWYYPRTIETLKKSPRGMKRFRDYLHAQGLTPGDVGAAAWSDVQPIGRSSAIDLPSRRLFYWTTRFFAADSSRHFAASTKALESAFYPGMPIFTNWNFFSGRLYVPGPVANNADKKSPDAAMGGHDWLEFGRMRGGTMLWTEDWFGDSRAYQWSFYCSKLHSAASKSDVVFGAYIIPRTAGEREDGILQRILCCTGHGARAIKYFVFGPEYNFPGNCYSERAKVLPKMAEAHRMIGAAEELLWAGRKPKAQVAILSPRSSQMWDAKDQVIAKGISDATNNNLNAGTVDYLAETFDLYLALQHANVPCDFVDEDDLSLAGLKDAKVLYVTEPNMAIERQKSLAEWVRAGGTLVTVSNAATRDRYDEPCSILRDALGIVESPRQRLLVGNAAVLKKVSTGDSKFGAFDLFGVASGLTKTDGAEVLAWAADKSPLTIHRKVGKGQFVHFAWLPGVSYFRTGKAIKGELPSGFSPGLRRLIVEPTAFAGVKAPVRVEAGGALIETPMLISGKGAAITVLNWSNQPQSATIDIDVPFRVGSVIGVKSGNLKHTATTSGARVQVTVGAAEILLVRP